MDFEILFSLFFLTGSRIPITTKNIIPKIYRYEELTINYIKLIKDNNVRSRILLLLVEHMNKCTPNETVFIGN